MKRHLHEYSDKLHELETLGGYNIHHKTEEVLQGLGFANADLQQAIQGIQRWMADAGIAGKNDPAATRSAVTG